MNTRNLTPIVAIVFAFALGWPSIIFAEPVYIYGRDDFDLPIPANPDDTKGWMADAVIEIPDHFVISDLNVRLTLTHGALFDLQVLLQSPLGTSVVLNPAGNPAFIVRGEDGRLRAYGGSVDWVFDDGADISIKQSTVPFVGAFKPVESLSKFDGQDSFGSWRLRIYDNFIPDTGVLNSAKIMITIPEPASAILLAFGAGLIGLFRPTRNR